MTDGEWLERRSRYLADGLRADGLLRSGVVVLCCDDHAKDRLVARAAGQRLGRPVVAVDERNWHRGRLRQIGREFEAPLVLACQEGTEAWQGSGARGRVVGDATGVRWWRIVELHGRVAAHDLRGVAAC